MPSISAEPTILSTDNKAARDLSYNPEHHGRSKHIARRHFFIRDMVESQEIIVPIVNPQDNDADFFTKPLPPKRFKFLRRKVMNLDGGTISPQPSISRGFTLLGCVLYIHVCVYRCMFILLSACVVLVLQ